VAQCNVQEESGSGDAASNQIPLGFLVLNFCANILRTLRRES